MHVSLFLIATMVRRNVWRESPHVQPHLPTIGESLKTRKTSSSHNCGVPNNPEAEAIIKFNVEGSKEYYDLFEEGKFTPKKAPSFDSLAEVLPNITQ